MDKFCICKLVVTIALTSSSLLLTIAESLASQNHTTSTPALAIEAKEHLNNRKIAKERPQLTSKKHSDGHISSNRKENTPITKQRLDKSEELDRSSRKVIKDKSNQKKSLLNDIKRQDAYNSDFKHHKISNTIHLNNNSCAISNAMSYVYTYKNSPTLTVAEEKAIMKNETPTTTSNRVSKAFKNQINSPQGKLLAATLASLLSFYLNLRYRPMTSAYTKTKNSHSLQKQPTL